MQHLLAGCSFSRQVWHEILAWARSTAELPNEETDFHILWATFCVFVPIGKRMGLGSLIILTAWWLWKHRNGCVLDGDRSSVSHLYSTIKDEARLWARVVATANKSIILGS